MGTFPCVNTYKWACVCIYLIMCLFYTVRYARVYMGKSFTTVKCTESLSGGYIFDFGLQSAKKKKKKPTNYPFINKRLHLAFNE